MEKLLATHDRYNNVKLAMIGGLRVNNSSDAVLLDSLRTMIKDKGLENNVEIMLNVTDTQKMACIGQASVAIHTMVDEHFGISPVELMAGGAVVVAHNSGGPKKDIVLDGVTGYLCKTADEYCQKVCTLLDDPEMQAKMANKARSRAHAKFSDVSFKARIMQDLEQLFKVYT
eukprot:CAMPEP_0168528578 /NCGR_PEP_ID=MMETSP0405-20121227/13341_1 /TAXON_ID=498012 /ORGANISM="Trichosphaerium sp, Strain Am-I-7 wt" /LENGTH=171 /DNA_ID=CAMNT_0008552027 /DNA_START=462 /DNA_END=977 /DNA_ORIENTATION=+